MIESKLVKLVIFYLLDGEKPKHKVTERIKNYTKEEQSLAISQLLKSGYVQVREQVSNGRGRTPTFISLTEKGEIKALGYSSEPIHKSIWAI